MGEVLQKDIRFAREAILNDILEILEDLTSDWEMEFLDKIGPETRLVSDLTFESIDIVQLSVSVEEHFDHRRLPFQKLIMKPDGQYVEDVQVSELVDFLYSALNDS